MDAARWKTIKELLANALDRPIAERAAFVQNASADAGLRAEVMDLLDAYETSGALRSLAADDREYELAPGAEVGPYRIRLPIGRGGGGEVYRARDTRLQRDVALKLLTQSSSHDEGTRRVREARAAAQLNHRGIAAIYDIVEVDSRAAIVMEYVSGDTLADRLRSRAPDPAVVIGVGVEMADAVAHAHAAGIVHCDLKPGNMRFAADGSLRILDFGLARRPASVSSCATEENPSTSAVSGLTASSLDGLALGTPGYMSPEQLLGQAIDCRTDVYSMGVVLYEMAAGRRPFLADGDNDMATAVAVLSTPLPDLPRDVPRKLRSVIVKCLGRLPEHRYRDGAELRDALTSIAAPSPWRLGWKA